MTYEIASVENDGQFVRTFQGSRGPLWAFKITTADGLVAEVNKQKPDTPPAVGERYTRLTEPPSSAPEGALPTLRDKEYEGSSNGASGSGGGGGWSPEKEKRVARQSAQQRAALFVIAKALITQEQAEFNLTKFREIVDWCSDDAEEAAKK